MAADAADRQERLCWLALRLVPGLGHVNLLKLIRIFGSPRRVFEASLGDLKTAQPGLPLATAESIHSGISFEDASDELRKAQSAGVQLISFSDEAYPPRLKQIHDPPALLYALGRTELLQTHSVAVVGTRRPTPYGRAVAEKLSRDLVRLGLTHISGLARGVDGASHRGALDGGGATIAVLGTGVDVPYPRENRKLYEEIASRGLLVSEFPMGTRAFPQNFPIRNRIISGIGYGVLVVEGGQYSGSLISARLALEQGREVFATPGSILSRQSWGPNLLIKDGAKLIQEASDVVEELPLEARRQLHDEASRRAAGAPNGSSRQPTLFGVEPSPLGRRLLTLLHVEEALHIDDIIRSCPETSSPDVLAALSELELSGAIRQLPGKHFVLVWSD